MTKIVGIYKITSPSGRVYIGQSWNIKKRWANHKCMCGASALNNSFRKYGTAAHAFEIIHPLPGDILQDTMNAYEQLYMDAYRECGICLLNIVEGGGNIKGFKHSKETRAKLSIIQKGRVQSEEAREKNRQSQLGRKHPEHVKAKIGQANKNSKRPDLAEYNRVHKKGQSGRLHSQETKDKIGKAHKGKAWGKGRIQSEQEKKMRSEMTRKWWEERKSKNDFRA